MPSFDSTAAPPPRAFRVLALPPSGPDLLEGAAVLAEVPGDTGVLLFQSLRNVTLWSAAGREERAALFAPGAEARRRAALESAAPDEALRPALETLARLLGAPAAVRAAEVADACEQVARWAE
ncbi:MAG TPA: hypothetical protein VFX98_10145, partial [Longimicrobiaceae bacterium]|nr:hypothetical protein [Longimicrobiaceae bacterium]